MDKNTLIEKYNTTDSKGRMNLLDNLTKEIDISSIPPLIEICEKENERALKEKILFIISKMITEIDFKVIERMLLSSDPFVRNGAVELLKENREKMYPMIEQFSKHKDKDVRKFAIDALTDDSSKEAIKILGESLKDREINIRITAIEYLGNIGAKDYSETIEELLLKEENILLKCTALETLAKIGYSPRSGEIIDKFSEENNPMIIFSFLKYLGAFGGTRELNLIDKIIERDETLFNREYIDAIEKIQTRAKLEELPTDIVKRLENIAEKTDNSPLKYEIIKLLNKVKEEDLDEVREKLNSEDEMEILSAVEILRDRGTAEDIELLEELADRVESDEILEAIGDAVETIRERATK